MRLKNGIQVDAMATLQNAYAVMQRKREEPQTPNGAPATTLTVSPNSAAD
jgi:hypothetical protein